MRNEVAYGVHEKTRIYLCVLCMPALGRGFGWTRLVETRLQRREGGNEGRVPCTIYTKGLLNSSHRESCICSIKYKPNLRTIHGIHT
jgi:hypothetical protein